MLFTMNVYFYFLIMRSMTGLSTISIFGANIRSLYLFSAKIRGNCSFFFRISCILSIAAVCFQSYPHFSCSLSTVYSQPTYYLWQRHQLDDTSGLYGLWRHTLLSESAGLWRKSGTECWPPVFQPGHADAPRVSQAFQHAIQESRKIHRHRQGVEQKPQRSDSRGTYRGAENRLSTPCA